MLLILGMLFLRALVPAGFMLAPVEGGLAIVLCEPDVLAASGHHHFGHDHAAHHHGAHGDPTCPYAQSAGPAPLPTLPALTGGAPPLGLASLPVATQTRLSFGPRRQPVSRGPPLLA